MSGTSDTDDSSSAGTLPRTKKPEERACWVSSVEPDGSEPVADSVCVRLAPSLAVRVAASMTKRLRTTTVGRR
ncbi:MAG: hypothetical protein KF795_01495 [Labilithrix sp.]|nr:hypothetical protein [Labilithrix sp.]